MLDGLELKTVFGLYFIQIPQKHVFFFLMENAHEGKGATFLNVLQCFIHRAAEIPSNLEVCEETVQETPPVMHNKMCVAWVLLVINVICTAAFSSGGLKKTTSIVRAPPPLSFPPHTPTHTHPPSVGVLCRQDLDRLRQSFKRTHRAHRGPKVTSLSASFSQSGP